MLDNLPKKPLMLTDLPLGTVIDKVIVESIEQALFRMEIEIDRQIFYIKDSKKRILTKRSIIEMQALLKPYQVNAMYLRHVSPYDEMIGFDNSDHNNELLLQLGDYFADEKPKAHH